MDDRYRGYSGDMTIHAHIRYIYIYMYLLYLYIILYIFIHVHIFIICIHVRRSIHSGRITIFYWRQTKPVIGFIRLPAEGRWKPCPVQRHGLLMFIDDCCCLYPCCLSPPLLLFCLVKLPLLFGKNHNCLTYPFVLLVCCSDLNWAAQVHVFDHLCWSNPILFNL